MATIYFDNRLVTNIKDKRVSGIKQTISSQSGYPSDDLYVLLNGKLVTKDIDLTKPENVVRICCRVVGGKGGFGSMLRAIGAQIEKTTNREACRDLSGRRLRDINEEKRLRKWLEGQEDREREAAERKQKKLERMIAVPKIEVNLNPDYEKDRQELPDRVNAAIDAGWQAAGTSKEGIKRKAAAVEFKKKKAKLWIDADLSDCSSLSEDDDQEVKSLNTQTVSTDSGNESDRASGSSKA